MQHEGISLFITDFPGSAIFIQIDAHVLIDIHPLHHQGHDRHKWMKLMIFVSNMHRLMILRSDFDPIIMYQLQVLPTLSAQLSE